MITLRPYQRAAIDALYAWFAANHGNPLLVLPTGAGKSIIQAAFIEETLRRWPGQRVLMLTHVKELIEQNADKLTSIWPEAPLGIYSAGMGQRVYWTPIVYASIQSVHKRAELLGHFDLIVIDEAHLVPTRSATMYRRFLAAMGDINPDVRIIGMSATPYRLDSGQLHTGDDAMFSDIAYELPLLDLIDAGHLVPLISKGGVRKIDMADVSVRAGEFVTKDIDAAVHAEGLTEAAVSEIIKYGHLRRSWLVFCPSVDYAFEVRDVLRARGVAAETLHGGTPKAERAQLISDYRAMKYQALVNCDVLTTGFDAPTVDLIAFLRPTQSTALYVQMCGRGMRISPETGKKNCLVLDFAGNVARHGPVDAVSVRDKRGGSSDGTGMPPTRECPDCQTIIGIWEKVCPDCGYTWPVVEIDKHAATASDAAMLSRDLPPQWLDVTNVTYARHSKPDRPDSVRVTYWCGLQTFDEWICIEHQGYARAKADAWLRERGFAQLSTVGQVLDVANEIPAPTRVRIAQDGKFQRVAEYEFGKKSSAA